MQRLDESVGLKHQSVLLTEAPTALVSNPTGVYVDATFGRGGHTRELLGRLAPEARLFAFDRDAEAYAVGETIEDRRLTMIRSAFSRMQEELLRRGVRSVDGVLMDIGVSSPQIDDAKRGFSFRLDGPLDMRMDQSREPSACTWLQRASAETIETVLREYGEERFAKAIARAIVCEREAAPIETTRRLADIVSRTVPRAAQDASQHPATRTFQAIRIAVNDELGELKRGLAAAGALLRENGRLVVISFHSLEDRIVKRFFEVGAHPERGIDPRVALRDEEMPRPLWADVRRVKPTQGECCTNPRARSAVMRVARRTARAWPELVR